MSQTGEKRDVILRQPVEKSDEGLPIGNGRMGTLVWTAPERVEFQVNRADVFAANRGHGLDQAAPMSSGETTADYCGACARVRVALGGEVFCGEDFEQRLSMVDAEVGVFGRAVAVRCFVSAERDLLVIEVDDRRQASAGLTVELSAWGPLEVCSGGHVARWRLTERDGCALVLRSFEEGGYYCGSAVGAMVEGGSIEVVGDGGMRLAKASGGKSLIVVASAGSRSREADLTATVVDLLGEVRGRSYDELQIDHRRWWSAFWSRSEVSIASEDPAARRLEHLRDLHLYHLGSTSRGPVPPKWNGSLFVTEGDVRSWGSQYWVWTTESLYFPLYAADLIELTEPFFRMYGDQLEACRAAARQRWGVGGAFFPETNAFDGPTVLPDGAGCEFQEAYLGRKPVAALSSETKELCRFDSSLRTVAWPAAQAEGRFSWISHLVSSGCEVATQAWWRYRYTGDLDWLGRVAYPLLRETVEFYRGLVREGADGRLHVCGTNVHEAFWGVDDGIMDLAAIRGVAPLAIRVAEMLDTDRDLRAGWRDLLERVAPYPMGCDAESQAIEGGALAEDVWSVGHLGAVCVNKLCEDVWLTPVFPFEDWTLETDDPETARIVRKLVSLAPRLKSILEGEHSNTADRTPVAVARAGLGEFLPEVLARYDAAFSPMANGMSRFEGHQAMSVEPLGIITTALQEGLLQSVSRRPGELEAIRVFAAWPRRWDASFRLLARGGFVVRSSISTGRVEFVEIESRLGGTCRVRLPWEAYRFEGQAEGEVRCRGGLVEFETRRGGRYRLAPA